MTPSLPRLQYLLPRINTMASCPCRIHHQLVSFFVSDPRHHALPNASAFIRGTALLPNDDVLLTADASTKCFEENLLPNGILLPNSAHMSVSSLYQFLVLTIGYKSHANTEGKLMARLTEFHRQQRPSRRHPRIYSQGLGRAKKFSTHQRGSSVRPGKKLYIYIDQVQQVRRWPGLPSTCVDPETLLQSVFVTTSTCSRLKSIYKTYSKQEILFLIYFLSSFSDFVSGLY
jgi:hypothetical protein